VVFLSGPGLQYENSVGKSVHARNQTRHRKITGLRLGLTGNTASKTIKALHTGSEQTHLHKPPRMAMFKIEFCLQNKNNIKEEISCLPIHFMRPRRSHFIKTVYQFKKVFFELWSFVFGAEIYSHNNGPQITGFLRPGQTDYG